MQKTFALATLTALALALCATPTFADAAVCPQLAQDLPELLASAMPGVGPDGEVRASFDVDARGVVRSISLEGTRRYQSRVRTALESLECTGGTPQRYVLKIRFAAPTPSMTRASAATSTDSKPR
ncbi:MAG TPA: hypothetical protein VGM81_03620 [Burkholderiaceae bacterium]|jgi:hypothetical protein